MPRELPTIARNETLIFTDGASKGNPGSSGWGALIVRADGHVIELGGGHLLATNNQMELLAVMQALRYVASLPGRIQLCSDSAYVLDGIQKWLPSWRRSNWLTKAGTPVANQTLWQQLDALVQQKQRTSPITWIHLPGHAGIPGNERADQIAEGFAAQKPVELFNGSLTDYSFDPYNITPDLRKLAAKKQRNQKAYSYLSMVDGKIERHSTWPECQARVHGKSGAKFKKTLDPIDEAETMQMWTRSS